MCVNQASSFMCLWVTWEPAEKDSEIWKNKMECSCQGSLLVWSDVCCIIGVCVTLKKQHVINSCDGYTVKHCEKDRHSPSTLTWKAALKHNVHKKCNCRPLYKLRFLSLGTVQPPERHKSPTHSSWTRKTYSSRRQMLGQLSDMRYHKVARHWSHEGNNIESVENTCYLQTQKGTYPQRG